MSLKVAKDEYVVVDVTTSLAALTYPALNLIIITGLCWMGIGFIDQPQPQVAVDTGMRNIFVGLWALLAVWFFLRPVMKLRRKRVILTDRRLILRTAGFSGYSESIPLGAIRMVGRKGSTITLSVSGYSTMLAIPDVPRARKVADLIEQQRRAPLGHIRH